MPSSGNAGLDDVYEEVARVFQLKPVSEEVQGHDLVARALFLPSFHPECAITLMRSGSGILLDVYSAKRSIWAHMNARKGVLGFSDLENLPEPAIAHEVVELANLGGGAELVGEAQSWTAPSTRSLGIDGMSVRVELQERRTAKVVFDLWFGTDAKTPPGRLTQWLGNIALKHCSWELTRERLTDLSRYAT